MKKSKLIKKPKVKEVKSEKAGAEPVKKVMATPQALRGMKDILPADQPFWLFLTDKARALA